MKKLAFLFVAFAALSHLAVTKLLRLKLQQILTL